MTQGDWAVQISYGNGGWIRVDSETLPGPLYLRLAPDEAGGWHTREVYLDGEDRRIDAADLRNIPLRALEIEILADGGVATVAAKARIPGADLATLASHYASGFAGRGARTWVTDSFLAQLPGGAELRVPKRAPAAPITRKPVPPLTAPDEGLTDEFLSHVAASYRAAVATRKRPGPELAGQAGVPVRTVHRWIYIARQRGFIPPSAKRPMSKQEDLATRTSGR